MMKALWNFRLFSMVVAVLLFSVIVVVLPRPSHALLILDDMIFIGPKSSAAIFKVKNATKVPEAYRLDWTQLQMLPNGRKDAVPDNVAIPNVMPAEPYMYMSPRRLLLRPDQLQHVRFMVRRMENLAPGEYRSYIVFQPEIVPDQYDPATGSSAAQGTSIQLNMLSGFRIPVFFLHGQTSLKTFVTESGYGRNAQGKAGVYFTFVREGNRSAIGDMEVRCMVGEQLTKIASTGIKVYTELNSRNYFLSTRDLPPGCNTLYLDYRPHSGDPDYTEAFVRMAEIPVQ